MSKLSRKSLAAITVLALAAGVLWLSSSISGASTVDLGTTSEANQALAASAASTAPIWMKNAVIYQVNTRQYSAAGTFDAVTADLGRLQKLGVDILWLMPIHPIGEEGRKGSMGSPYSVADYYGVNPDLGTEADLRELINGAHAKGMKVILDWVANHSSFDNPWITDHKDWYTQDGQGNVVPPNAEWTDVADLNFDVPEMREGMIDALEYWVREFDGAGGRARRRVEHHDDFVAVLFTLERNQLVAIVLEAGVFAASRAVPESLVLSLQRDELGVVGDGGFRAGRGEHPVDLIFFKKREALV